MVVPYSNVTIVDNPLGLTVPVNVAPAMEIFVTGWVELSGTSFLQPAARKIIIAARIVRFIRNAFFMPLVL